jgi:hypothetical protein
MFFVMIVLISSTSASAQERGLSSAAPDIPSAALVESENEKTETNTEIEDTLNQLSQIRKETSLGIKASTRMTFAALMNSKGFEGASEELGNARNMNFSVNDSLTLVEAAAIHKTTVANLSESFSYFRKEHKLPISSSLKATMLCGTQDKEVFMNNFREARENNFGVSDSLFIAGMMQNYNKSFEEVREVYQFFRDNHFAGNHSLLLTCSALNNNQEKTLSTYREAREGSGGNLSVSFTLLSTASGKSIESINRESRDIRNRTTFSTEQRKKTLIASYLAKSNLTQQQRAILYYALTMR